MLTDYYTALHAERLRSGPSGSHLDDFSAWLTGCGYQPNTVRPLMRGAVCFATWAATEGLDPLDDTAAAAYRAHLEAARRQRLSSGTSVVRGPRLLVDFLAEVGVDLACFSDLEPLGGAA